MKRTSLQPKPKKVPLLFVRVNQQAFDTIKAEGLKNDRKPGPQARQILHAWTEYKLANR